MRNYKIVNIRAIAIILVVLGHSIILYQSNWGLYTTTVDAPAFDYFKSYFIDLFQMPLFFSVSGFLFEGSYKKNTFLNLTIKKAKRILLPFVVVAFCYLLPIRLLIHYPGYQGKSIFDIVIRGIIIGKDVGHLWYLQTIFIIFVLSWLVFRALDRLKNVYIQATLVLLLSLVLSTQFYRASGFVGSGLIQAFAINWVWFCFGFVIRRCELVEKLHRFKWAILFMFLIQYVLYITVFSHPYYKPILVLFGVLSMYLIMPNKTNKPISFISDNSFGLYLFHSPLVYITYSVFPNMNPIFTLLINFIGFGSFAIIVTLLIRRTKLRFIIGE